MSKLIAYSGTHGTGKTTSTYTTAHHLKHLHRNKSIHVLVDQEALSPFTINQTATEEGQLWLFTNKIQYELFLLNKFDIVITDRTIIDIIAYTKYLKFHSLAEMMFTVAQEYIYRYSKITFKKIKTNEFWYPDGIRDTRDCHFRKTVELILSEYYQHLTQSRNFIGELNYE